MSRRHHPPVLAIALSLGSVTGCHGGDEAPVGPAVSISTTPAAIAATVGSTVAVTASVAGVSSAGGTVHWSSNDPGIAAVDTTVALGEAALVRAVSGGTTTVVALVELRNGVAAQQAISATVTAVP